MNEKLEKIQGEVDCVRYVSDDETYCVIDIACEDELITAVGEMGGVEEGEDVVLTGYHTVHRKFGKQFKVVMFERSLPTKSASIMKYLSSGALKSVTPVIARKLVRAFGDSTLDVIENEPEKLYELKGIEEELAAKIVKEFNNSFAVRSLLVYMNGREVPTKFSVRAWKRWGKDAQSLIKSNPYVLCTDGIDLAFQKADEIAEKEDIPRDSKARIKAGISWQLKEFAGEGNTCMPLATLRSKCISLLSVSRAQFEEVLQEGLDDEDLYRWQLGDTECIMLRTYYKAEEYIARRLELMKSITYDNKIDFSTIIDLEEQESGIHYEKIQRQAINLALSKGFLVLTGGPGTGKTTTLNAMINLFDQQGLEVLIAAPTGRAAKRLSDLTGCEAKTIHRLLEVRPNSDDTLSFVHDEEHLLDCDVLIVDEMSMVDSCLFEALLRAISVTCKLILVGDSDQLPSVGAGNVLKDIIDSGVMSVITLKEVFRQAQESGIVMNAHRIVDGKRIDYSKREKDFAFMQRLEFDSMQDLVVDLCKNRLVNYGFTPESIQVLSPTKKGPSGTRDLNKILQQELNPPEKGKAELKTKFNIYRMGDKVMQTRNDYDVLWEKDNGDDESETGAGIFNGDIGVVVGIDKLRKTATIDFDGRIAEFSGDMLDDIELAYAVTVHKSQGSEYEAVILTILGGPDMVYYRNLLYTAVTRAKKLLVIVGSTKRTDFMIDNNVRTIRYTALRSMLMNKIEGSDEGQLSI